MLGADVQRDLIRLLRAVASAREDLLTLRDSASPGGAAAIFDAFGNWLYENWYSVPGVAPAPASNRLQTNLPAAFRAALPSSTRWLSGWVVMEIGDYGACVAGRRGQARELRCGEYVNVSRPGMPVMPGDGVAVMECVDWIDWPTGFWTTRSAAGEPTPPLIRLYWSVSEAYVGSILNNLTTALEGLGLRYSLKCPVSSVDFARVDPLVVYLERSAWEVAQNTVTELARDSEAYFRESSPPLTLRIARGVAFAEDPGANESFGQSRCRALAAGVIALLGESRRSVDRGIEILTQALEDANIDPECPWLNSVR